MSGPAEGGCPLCLQRHNLEYPGARTSTARLMHLKRESEAASSQNGNAVTHQTPAFCSFEVVPDHRRRNPDLTLAASAAV